MLKLFILAATSISILGCGNDAEHNANEGKEKFSFDINESFSHELPVDESNTNFIKLVSTPSGAACNLNDRIENDIHFALSQGEFTNELCNIGVMEYDKPYRYNLYDNEIVSKIEKTENGYRKYWCSKYQGDGYHTSGVYITEVIVNENNEVDLYKVLHFDDLNDKPRTRFQSILNGVDDLKIHFTHKVIRYTEEGVPESHGITNLNFIRSQSNDNSENETQTLELMSKEDDEISRSKYTWAHIANEDFGGLGTLKYVNGGEVMKTESFNLIGQIINDSDYPEYFGTEMLIDPANTEPNTFEEFEIPYSEDLWTCDFEVEVQELECNVTDSPTSPPKERLCPELP